MQSGRLLELIWQNEIEEAAGEGAVRFRRLLRALLPVRSVCLAAQTGIDHATTMLDETELMPALPLGDVLAEELGVAVPYGTLVVLSDAQMFQAPLDEDTLSHELGHATGEALLGVIRRGILPIEQESDALYIMACAYDQLVGGSGFAHLGLRPDAFRKGLAAALGTYWLGTRSCRLDRSGLFESSRFLRCPQMRSYLKSTDASFSGINPAQVPATLMLFTGGPRHYEDWLNEVERKVLTVLGAGTAFAAQTEHSARRDVF